MCAAKFLLDIIDHDNLCPLRVFLIINSELCMCTCEDDDTFLFFGYIHIYIYIYVYAVIPNKQV